MTKAFTITITTSPSKAPAVTIRNLRDLYEAIHTYGPIDEGFEPCLLDDEAPEVLCDATDCSADDAADEALKETMTQTLATVIEKLKMLEEEVAAHSDAIRSLFKSRCSCKDTASKKNKGSKKPCDHNKEVPASACVSAYCADDIDCFVTN